ncbi:MAG: C40 family peptidase [Muribaculaceae bacterium]|nr:C40 family peptidase [Muribaculaceae bacterium]
MKILPLFVSLLLLIAAVSCKSHKATVIRASGPGVRVENSVKMSKGATSDPSFSNNQKVGDALVKAARTWIGTPYRYGGQSKSGTDCSGLTMVLYKDVANLALPRTAAQQAEYCFDIPQRELQPGDLVFFSTSSHGGKVSHVGMYIGGGKMIHASTSRGVIESSLDEKYYKNHYHSSGRVYGITYAGTGEKKPKERKPAGKSVEGSTPVEKSKPTPKSMENKPTKNTPAKGEVVEMTLDQFVSMKQKAPLRDTVIVAEHIIEATVAAIDSASAMVDSVKTKIFVDTIAPVRVEPVKTEKQETTPTVKVNGKRVPVTPVEQKPVQKTDSIEPDSVRQGREIRETVVKAMKFGK